MNELVKNNFFFAGSLTRNKTLLPNWLPRAKRLESAIKRTFDE